MYSTAGYKTVKSTLPILKLKFLNDFLVQQVLHKSVSYSFPNVPNDCAFSEHFTLNFEAKISQQSLKFNIDQILDMSIIKKR